MELLIGFVFGGIIIAYWRDKKFRAWINSKVFKKSQPEKKQEEKKEIPKDNDHPII